MKSSKLLGREELNIEYGIGKTIVDHWQFGPHHIWKDVNTGRIIRQWQSVNALYVH